MKQTHSHLFVLYFCFIAAGQVALGVGNVGFHRQECYQKVSEMLQTSISSITADPSIFISKSDPTNPILTLDGCKQLCGSGTGWYQDSGPRLISWLLPIIILVFNMQFAPVGMERFLLVLHLLGDPIDSTWSLLTKVDTWNNHIFHAQKRHKGELEIKSLAMISAAAEELPRSLNLNHAFKLNASHNKNLVIETALTLFENKRNEILRTLFAIALYVFQVLAAFVPAVGATSSPSGGRIATAMLLSWLLPVVLLSNTVGDFGSLRNRQRIIAEFMDRLGQPSDQNFCAPKTSRLTLSLFGVQKEAQLPYETYVAWSGAIYCYRPNKRFFHASGAKLAFISVLPVAIAFGTAFAVLDTGPTYFSCRHILVIAVFGVWIVSAILTSWLSRASFATGKYTWVIILSKDTVIAIPSLTLILASSCGLWNTCYCWSGALLYGKSARAPLNPTKVFDKNQSVIYPAIVATGLSLQVCIYVLMLWVGWPGFRAMWWNKNEKRAASDFSRGVWVSSAATQTK